MADIIYPQRWLKEHKAVASVEGWRRPNTKELLKCQKGLDIPPEPELKTVSTSGVPTNLTIDETGGGTFTFNYSFTDIDYVPVSVTCTSTTDGAATVTNEKVTGSNSFKVTIVGGSVDEKVTVKVTIDTVSSTNRTTTLIQDAAK